jgi:hypothetical protein
VASPRRRAAPPAWQALALACLLALVPAGAAGAKPPRDLAAHPGALVRVPRRYLPEFRWWWPSDSVDPAELRSELRSIKAAGFGAVEQSLLANDRQWGTPTFRQRTETALREANRLGLKLDITLGPGWPISAPVTDDLSKEISSQDLHYGAVELSGPTTYAGPVPDDPPPGSGQKRLVAVTAIRVLGNGVPQVLDPSSALDLTGRVQVDGTLTWPAPAGEWKLFGFWMRPTRQRANAPAGGLPGWYEVDHFSRSAIGAVLGDFDRMLFGGEMAALLRRNDGDVFEDSLEVEHGPVAGGQSAVFWTPKMLSDFAARRGYDLTPLLPGLFREFAFPDGLSSRLRHDFDRTLNDLLIEDHLKPIAAWAHRKGLRSRAQAYQAGVGGVATTENDRLAAALDRPDVETLGFGDPSIGQRGPVELGSADGRAVLDRYRQVVSGAHLSGAKVITNEWGAVFVGQFGVEPKDLKALADRSLAAGVTRMALHGFAYRLYARAPGIGPSPTWPGWCAWCGGGLEFADSWNQRWPQFRSLRGLTAYLGRAGAALRGGRPRVDLTLLNATSVVNGIGPPQTGGTPEDRLRRALGSAGFTWDALDPGSIDRLGDPSGRRLVGRGPAYRALVVDDQHAIPGAAAERLVHLARTGFPIVVFGAVPQAGAGYRDAQGEDARVKAAIHRLRGLPRVRFARSPAGLLAALRALSVRPDFRPRRPTPVVPVHRRTARGDVWFLYNDSPRRAGGRYDFATTGAPSRIDLWTGRARRLAVSAGRRPSRVTLRLSLRPGETTLLSFDRRESGRRGERPVFARTLLAPLQVAGPWRLHADTVAPGGDAAVDLTLPTLDAWEEIPELLGRSGTGSYSATVRIPRRCLGRRHGVLLDPGAFGGALRVWINGHGAAVPTVPGEAPREITSLLHAGSNALRLEVSTTLSNAMRTEGLSGDLDYARYATRPLVTSGLIGPVRLIPFTERRQINASPGARAPAG